MYEGRPIVTLAFCLQVLAVLQLVETETKQSQIVLLSWRRDQSLGMLRPTECVGHDTGAPQTYRAALMSWPNTKLKISWDNLLELWQRTTTEEMQVVWKSLRSYSAEKSRSSNWNRNLSEHSNGSAKKVVGLL